MESPDPRDDDASVYPGAKESCDDRDQDCDGTVDNDVAEAPLRYPDTDGDGFGSAEGALPFCDLPDGYVDDNTDCTDEDAARNPGATELCNEIDDDCDGLIDNDDPTLVPSTSYEDRDGDGYGSEVESEHCESAGSGWVSTGGDCNDSDSEVNPGAVELCEGIDNDCDELVDEDDPSVRSYFQDRDGDTYGDPRAPAQTCTLADGVVANDDDCDDSDASVTPLLMWYPDEDEDGLAALEGAEAGCTGADGWLTGVDGFDCDDADPAIGAGEGPDADARYSLLPLPAGEFQMGTTDRSFYVWRSPMTVRLSHDALIGQHELTRAEYSALMGVPPSTDTGCGDNCPADELTWGEAAVVANAASAAACLPACYTCTGTTSPDCKASLNPYACAGYRLPTSAEWEYAARSGGAVTDAFPNGGGLDASTYMSDPWKLYYTCSEEEYTLTDGSLLGDQGWYCGNSGGTMHPVEQKLPNALGLYDTLGNVCEWTADGTLGTLTSLDPWRDDRDGTYGDRVARGGSWGNPARSTIIDHEGQIDESEHNSGLGLRLVRSDIVHP